MRIVISLLALIFSSLLFSQSNHTSHSFSYKLTEDIKEEEEKRYLNALDYLKQDSLFCGKEIYFSPYLADLDLIYFKDVTREDSILNSKLIMKYKWFDDYYSARLNRIFDQRSKKKDYIAFFSLIENDLLRVDVFVYRQNVSSLQFKDVSLFSGGGTKAYLFDFNKETDEIKSVFMIEIIYD